MSLVSTISLHELSITFELIGMLENPRNLPSLGQAIHNSYYFKEIHDEQKHWPSSPFKEKLWKNIEPITSQLTLSKPLKREVCEEYCAIATQDNISHLFDFENVLAEMEVPDHFSPYLLNYLGLKRDGNDEAYTHSFRMALMEFGRTSGLNENQKQNLIVKLNSQFERLFLFYESFRINIRPDESELSRIPQLTG